MGAELSVYVAQGHTSHGVGRKLYGALMELLAIQGVRTVYGIVTVPNEKSEGLHRTMGFQDAGICRNTGYVDGAWRDVQTFEKAIGPYDLDPVPITPLSSALLRAGAKYFGKMELKNRSIPLGNAPVFLYFFFLCDLMGRRRRHRLVMLHRIKVVLIHQGGFAVLEYGNDHRIEHRSHQTAGKTVVIQVHPRHRAAGIQHHGGVDKASQNAVGPAEVARDGGPGWYRTDRPAVRTDC